MSLGETLRCLCPSPALSWHIQPYSGGKAPRFGEETLLQRWQAVPLNKHSSFLSPPLLSLKGKWNASDVTCSASPLLPGKVLGV